MYYNPNNLGCGCFQPAQSAARTRESAEMNELESLLYPDMQVYYATTSDGKVTVIQSHSSEEEIQRITYQKISWYEETVS